MPWYGVSPRYVQSINHGHVRAIENPHLIAQQPGAFVGRYPYAHRWYEPALTVAPGSSFIGQRPIAGGGQRWILEPGARQAFSDPSRGPGVVLDPGLRPGWTRPQPGFSAGRPPPGAVEPDRRLQIPERVARPPIGGGGADRPVRPDEGAFPGQRPNGGVWTTVRPPVEAAPRAVPPFRPPSPPVYQAPARSPGAIDTRPNEEAARRIGGSPFPAPGRDMAPAPRPEGFPWRPAVPPPAAPPPSMPRVLQSAPPPVMPQPPAPPRSFGRVEPPPRPADAQRPPEPGRVQGGWDPHRQREAAR